MKILLEDTIPFGCEYLAPLGEVTTYAWQTLSKDAIKQADIMAIRSTTQINQQSIAPCPQLNFVTTATAGTNHMDTDWLDSQGITWDSAGGCNAVAVAEYVVSTVLQADKANIINIEQCTVGIVGAGHVGTALSKLLDALNIHYKLCDPPLEAQGDSREFYKLQDILTCDVISLHVPFVKSGPFATGHLIDADALAQMSSSQLFINACRGEVVDEAALIARLSQENPPIVALDVFANEPNINRGLLALCWQVTPHIAGHSVEGKVRGTQIIYEQICAIAGKPVQKKLSDVLEVLAPTRVALTNKDADSLTTEDLTALFLSVYDVKIDDATMRDALSPLSTLSNDTRGATDDPAPALASQFSTLRKQYRVRRECSAYTLILPEGTSNGIKQQLMALGFAIHQ
tara:strand:- start:3920 stop:5122 length:1203 start_codon:yes stop_codon:yes gene_type:complete